jgi:hypothetical protein
VVRVIADNGFTMIGPEVCCWFWKQQQHFAAGRYFGL